MTAVICNSFDCDHNRSGICTAPEMHHINKRCRTYYKSDMRKLMSASFKPNCHKRGGKYKSDGSHIVR